NRSFRTTRRSKLQVYRRYDCQGIYNLYSGTLLEGRTCRPPRSCCFCGVSQEPSARLARELELNRGTVLDLRRTLQAKAIELQPDDPLPDQHTETGEMFQNAGKRYSRQGRIYRRRAYATVEVGRSCLHPPF